VRSLVALCADAAVGRVAAAHSHDIGLRGVGGRDLVMCAAARPRGGRAVCVRGAQSRASTATSRSRQPGPS